MLLAALVVAAVHAAPVRVPLQAQPVLLDQTAVEAVESGPHVLRVTAQLEFPAARACAKLVLMLDGRPLKGPMSMCSDSARTGLVRQSYAVGLAAGDHLVELKGSVDAAGVVYLGDDGDDASVSFIAVERPTAASADGDLVAEDAPADGGSVDDFFGGLVGSGGQDVALLWTAPHSGDFWMDTFGSETDTVLTVFAGCSDEVVACNDDADEDGRQSMVSFQADEGESFLVVIDGKPGAPPGQVKLSVETSARGRLADARRGALGRQDPAICKVATSIGSMVGYGVFQADTAVTGDRFSCESCAAPPARAPLPPLAPVQADAPPPVHDDAADDQAIQDAPLVGTFAWTAPEPGLFEVHTRDSASAATTVSVYRDCLEAPVVCEQGQTGAVLDAAADTRYVIVVSSDATTADPADPLQMVLSVERIDAPPNRPHKTPTPIEDRDALGLPATCDALPQIGSLVGAAIVRTPIAHSLDAAARKAAPACNTITKPAGKSRLMAALAQHHQQHHAALDPIETSASPLVALVQMLGHELLLAGLGALCLFSGGLMLVAVERRKLQRTPEPSPEPSPTPSPEPVRKAPLRSGAYAMPLLPTQ